MKHEAQRIHRVVRHRECLNSDVANRKLRASRKQSPIATSVCETAGSKRFCCESIAVNRQIKSAAENFQAADVIGVLVCKNDPIDMLRRHAALLQTQHHL